MARRLFLVVKWAVLAPFYFLFGCVLGALILIEVPFYFIRWLITGREFPELPLLLSVIEGEWRDYIREII